MANQAKVFARVFDYQSNDQMAEGQMRFTVEWKLIIGTREGGKFVFLTTDPIVSDDKLRADMRDALADYLSDKFSPQTFRARDIVGYSV